MFRRRFRMSATPRFPERAAQEIVRLLEISRGRAFCLFTSYAQMNDLFERVRRQRCVFLC